MVALSAFADEISGDVAEQMAALHEAGIGHVDVRTVDDRDVMQLTRSQARALRDRLDAHGVEVASVASPIGRCPVDLPADQLRRQLDHASVLAHVLGTPTVRVFSFYPPGSAGPGNSPPADRSAWRESVLARLSAMTAWAREAGVELLVENDRGTYAESVAGASEVFAALGSEHLGMVFDPANFVHCGHVAFPDGYRTLAGWLRQVHVKDVTAEGQHVAAGRGLVGWPELLRGLHADGYQGFLSLEPGPAKFRGAAAALRELLADQGWAVADRERTA
jgi:3-dehydroshikimate dehydratase